MGGNKNSCNQIDTINLNFTDLGTWPLNITDTQRTYLVKMRYNYSEDLKFMILVIRREKAEKLILTGFLRYF